MSRDIEPTFQTIEQELLPMIASMLDSLLSSGRPIAATDYAETLRILAEKSDVMARGAIAAALGVDSPVARAASR